MDALTLDTEFLRRSARSLREKNFLPLLSRVRVDSLFLRAIAFELLRFCWLLSGRSLNERRTRRTRGRWIRNAISRQQYMGPVTDQVVIANTELTDDAPFVVETSIQLRTGSEVS
jgi:hypothetical protein